GALRVGCGVLRAIGAVVLGRACRAAAGPAGLVEDVEVQVGADAGELGAREGQRRGERVRRAEQDLGVRHALLGGDGCPPQCDEGQAEDRPSLSHDFLLVIAARPPGMNSMQMIMIAPKISGRKAWNPASESMSKVTLAAPATGPRTDPWPP